MLGHRTSYRKFSKIKIIPSISDNNSIKLEIKNKRKIRKCTNSWKLNITVLNNQWFKKEIKGEIKNKNKIKIKKVS